MICPDRLRTFHDKLLQSLEPCFDKQTGFVHLSSSSVPYASDRLIPLAENAAYALLLCKSKAAESIQRARKILQSLVKLQHSNGLFNRFLHEVLQEPCPRTSAKMMLVFKALLQWHKVAIGELAPSIEQVHNQLSQMNMTSFFEAKNLQDSCAVIGGCDMWHALYAHVYAAVISPGLIQRLKTAMTPWQSLNLLEGSSSQVSLAARDSWADVLVWLQGGYSPTHLGLCQLWSVLWHETRQPLFDIHGPNANFHVSYRPLEMAIQRRGAERASAWQLVTMQHNGQALSTVGLSADIAKVTVEPLADLKWKLVLDYQPVDALAHDEDRPLVSVRSDLNEKWLYKGTLSSAMDLSQMCEGIACSRLYLKILHAAGAFAHGYWRQHPLRSHEGQVLCSPTCSQLYFSSASLQQSGTLILELSLKG